MINSFLLIGQSNMAGRGALDEVSSIYNENIFVFKNNRWVIAQEPLHDDKPDLAGLGLGMSFAESLQRRFGNEIGLIPCAFGGTSLNEWQKGDYLYTSALSKTIGALTSSRLKGILWHQGESDSDHFETAVSYKERFLPFINSLVTDIGHLNIPIILGELGEFLAQHDECNYANLVNAGLKEVASKESDFSFVSAKNLTDNGDFLHFNSNSLREFGRRYADAWMDGSQRIGVCLE